MMAPLNGSQRRSRVPVNGLSHPQEPPPSSILASHVVQADGIGVPYLDQQHFSQLLDECLRCGEDEPLYSTRDPTVYHKLICCIIHIGIHAANNNDKNNNKNNNNNNNDPFVNGSSHRDELARCLDVIDMSIRRSPQALYIATDTKYSGIKDHDVPLFEWLISDLIFLYATGEKTGEEILNKIWNVLTTVATIQPQCYHMALNCGAISGFLSNCTDGASLTTAVFLYGDH